MKIAICVKYVPVDSKVQVDPAIHALLRAAAPAKSIRATATPWKWPGA